MAGAAEHEQMKRFLAASHAEQASARAALQKPLHNGRFTHAFAPRRARPGAACAAGPRAAARLLKD